MKTLAMVAWLLAAFTAFPPLVMILVGVDYETHEAWHIGEDVVAVVCLIVIGYFYIMVYRAVRKRKINDISQVAPLVKFESRVTMTTGSCDLSDERIRLVHWKTSKNCKMLNNTSPSKDQHPGTRQ